MRRAGALICAVGIAALLAVCATGTASARVVPFNGIEYTWLHHDDNGEPIADWIKRISDIVAVRNGDDMQFQNRWYNSYAGTVDLGISYGADTVGTCSGAYEMVHYGLNYGNYYPSSTGGVPFYSTVWACNATPYNLLVNHHYVYNGVLYGTITPEDRTLLFQWRAQDEPGDQQTPTATPTPTVKPSTTPVPLPSVTPKPSPGFGFDAVLLLAGLLIVGYVAARFVKER